MLNKNDVLAYLLIIIYAFVAIYNFTTNDFETRLYTDTDTYFMAAGSDFFSKEIWGGIRSPLVPLVYKILYLNQSVIITFQLIYSFVAWSFLGLVILMSLNHKVVGFTCATLVFLLSQTNNVVIWNYGLLSESIAISSTILWLGCSLFHFYEPSLRSTLLSIFSGFLFALSRDTNAYVLLVAALFFILNELISKIYNKKNLNIRNIKLVLAYLSFFVISSLSHNHGERWVFPFYNSMSQRILISPEKTNFFIEYGMPYNNALKDRAGKWASSDENAYYVMDELEGFRIWTQKNGKTTYVMFLLTHPEHTFIDPIAPFLDIVTMDLSGYGPMNFTPNIVGKFWTRIIDSRTVVLLVLITGFVLGGLLTARNKERIELRSAAILFLIMSVFHFLVAFHGDAMEVTRHSVIASIQYHFALIFSLFLLIDLSIKKSLGIPHQTVISTSKCTLPVT